MTDPTPLFGTIPVSNEPPSPAKIEVVQEGASKVSSYHLILNHVFYGQSLLVLTKHLCNHYRPDGTVSVQQGTRTATLRGITAEGIARGSCKFNGSPEDTVHWLQTQGIREEDVREGGQYGPVDWALLMHNLSLPGGTPPKDIFSLHRLNPVIEKHPDGRYRVSWTLQSKLFPEVSFSFPSKEVDGWVTGSHPNCPLLARRMKQTWWSLINRDFNGTQILTLGATSCAL